MKTTKTKSTALVKDETAARLVALAEDISSLYEQCVDSLKDSLTSAAEAGGYLLEAEKLLKEGDGKYGHWGPYLKECGIPARTATDWMKTARKLSIKSATLPIAAAIAEIAAERKEEREREPERLRQRALSNAKFEKEIAERQKTNEAERQAVERQDAEEDASMRARHAKEDAEWEADRPNRERRLTLAQDLVTAGWKAMATKLHPDKGGMPPAMAELNQIRDRLQSMVEATWRP